MANVDCRISRALQSYTITYPAPDETLLATPEALPTSEPATPQISYTIGPQHLPTVSPAGLKYVLTAILYAAGRNTDAAAQTVYYRIMKNGVSVATGSASVNAGNYWTHNHARFYDVVPGDVLACKLWATSAGVNWDYQALVVHLSRVCAGGPVVSNLMMDMSATYAPALTRGTPGLYMGANPFFYPGDSNVIASLASDFSAGITKPHATYGLYRSGYSDYYITSYSAQHATHRPYYIAQHRLEAISFRPLTLRV